MPGTGLSGTHPGPGYRPSPGIAPSAWAASAASGQGGRPRCRSSSLIWRPVPRQERPGRGDKNHLLNPGGKHPWHFTRDGNKADSIQRAFEFPSWI